MRSTLVGKEVWVRADRSALQIFCDDDRIADHDLVKPGKRSTDDRHLPDHRGDYRHRAGSFCAQRADVLGPEVGVYIREVFDSDDVLDQLRTVQAMVSHLQVAARAREAACVRASFYSSYRYGALKTVLRKGLDFAPLLITTVAVVTAPLKTRRFARNVREMLHHKTEHWHELH